jgi:hypothetical protein
VDYNLRNVGGDTPTATIIANVGPYDAWGISIDGSVPLIGKELVLPIGVSTQISTQSPYGPLSRNDVTGHERWRDTTMDAECESYGARAGRLAADQRCENTSGIFTAGDFLPPPSPKVTWRRIGPRAET